MLIPRSVGSLASICDDAGRYALNGILLTRDHDAGDTQPLAVATDGRRLMVATWQEPRDIDYIEAGGTAGCCQDARQPVPRYTAIVDGDELAKATRRLPIPTPARLASEKGRVLSHVVLAEPTTNGHVTLSATDGKSAAQLTAATIDGRFPRWRDVVPDYSGERGMSVQVNARMLAELLTAISTHAGNENDCVTITLSADEPHGHPVLVTAARQDGHAACGLLMPLYTHENERPTPAWSPVTKKAERANESTPAEAKPITESATPAEPKPVPPTRPRTTRPKTAKPEPQLAREPETVTANSSPASPAPPDWRELARRTSY